MKGFSKFMLAATLSLVCGCNLLDEVLMTEARGNGADAGAAKRDSITHVPSPPVIDTVILCAAVRCPDNYDWCLDTACGNARCEILLFRDGEIERTIPAGQGTNINSDPDFIHLIGDDIYTECPGHTENVICFNGDEVLRLPSRERLIGILNTEGHLFTLTQDWVGSGFVLREDEKEIMRNDLGVIFGGFDDPSYSETGALYEDDSHYHFCYVERGAFSKLHVVTDGIDEEISLPGEDEILDMKMIQDEPVVATRNGYGFIWSYARVYDLAEGAVIAGQCAKDTKGAPTRSCVVDTRTGALEALCLGEGNIYCGSDASWAVCCERKGEMTVYSTRGGIDFMPDAYYFFGARCAAAAGDNLLLSLTPRDRSVRPTLMLGDRVYELEGIGNGFIAGVSCRISRSR